MIKNYTKTLIIIMSLALLVACGSKGDANEQNNNNQNEVENNEINDENTNGNEEEEENDGENMAANENEEPSFADEVFVQDVSEILLDLEAIDLAENILIEHENKRYIEHEFITTLLDYEVTFDETNNVVEVYKEKGDFQYEPNHTNDGGALMDVSQIYDERIDDYNDTEEQKDEYGIVEFDDKLYLPVRLINMYLEMPVHYKKRNGIIELGEASEKTNIYDYAVENELQGNSATTTQTAGDVTIEGTNYEKGIKLTGINSANTELYTRVYGKFSFAEGFIYNKSKENEMTIFIGNFKDEIVEEVVIKPREIYEFKIDINGFRGFYVNAKTKAGADETAIVVGEFY